MKLRPGTPPPLRLESLSSEHSIAAFSSGMAAIDDFIRTQALPEQALGLSSVTVAVDPMTQGKVVAYFSLSPMSIRLDGRLLSALGIPKESIPYPFVGGFLLGRLGVEKSYQGQGIGEALVAIAVERCRKQRDSTGGVFLAVDAKTDELIPYYVKLGFARIGEGRRLVMRL